MKPTLRVYDKDLKLIGVINNATSVVWISRWGTFGEFEIHLPESSDIMSDGNFVMLNEDVYRMGRIEYILDNRDGRDKSTTDDCVYKGFTLLGILADRTSLPGDANDGYLVWNNKPTETIMRELVDSECINPSDTKRKLPYFIGGTNNKAGTKTTFKSRHKVVTDDLYELSCLSNLGVVVKFVPDESKFQFEVKEGVDRTYNSETVNQNAYLVSLNLKRILSYSFNHDTTSYKNTAYIGGEGDGADRKIVTIGDENTGFDRKEVFIDARDLQNEDTDDLTDNVLKERGKTKLASDYPEIVCVDYETIQEDYKTLWDLGDTVTVSIERYGYTANSIITEVQETYENGEYVLEPTFGATSATISGGGSSSSSSGSYSVERAGISSKFSEISASFLAVDRALITKADITDLDAVTARIGTLEANSVTTAYLTSNYATIDNLNANYATIANLNIEKARIDSIETDYVKTSKLEADYLTADTITGNYATISNLNTEKARISDLETNSVTTDYLTTNYLTADTITGNYATLNYITSNYANLTTLQSTYATISNLSAQTARIDTLETNSVTTEYLNANYIKADTIDSTYAKISTLESDYVKTDYLEASYIKVSDADIKYATIVNLNAEKARIDTISSNYVSTDYLTANYATITNLNAQTARIDTIVSDYITSDYLVSNYVKATDADIKYATVSNLNAEKARIDTISSKYVSTDYLTANYVDAITVSSTYATVDELTAQKARIDTVEADYVKTSYLTSNYLTATNISSTYVSSEYLNANYIKTSTIDATYAKISTLESDYATIVNLNSTNANVTKLTSDLADVNTLLAGKATITDLTATNANVTKLTSDLADVNTLVSKKASIDDLTATNANVSKLTTDLASANTLIAGKAAIADLDTANANIGTLNTKVADINTLLNGNLTSTNIQAGGITSDRLTVSDGYITNAMIGEVSANKINAGTLNTSTIHIASSSGNLGIYDNTIQISDGTNTRVQIGKDATNDYSLYVWDSNGNLMFDALGLKADGIKSGIIRNDMVSDTAAIAGSKLDIDSVITSVNGATTKIDSSKVKLNAENQTLDVAFGSLKDTVSDTKTETETNTTAISTANGKIDTLITNTTITKDGVTTQLKDAYNKTVTDVSGIQTTIGNQQSTLDTATGNITSLQSQQASFQTSLNGFSSTVSQTSAQSIVSMTDEYYLSTSKTALSGGSWVSTQPARSLNTYIWKRTLLTHGDGTTEYTDATCITGDEGEDSTDLKIFSSKGNLFRNNVGSTVLTVIVYHGSDKIMNLQDLKSVYGTVAYLEWLSQGADASSFTAIPSTDSRITDNGFTLNLTASDIDRKVDFECNLNY